MPNECPSPAALAWNKQKTDHSLHSRKHICIPFYVIIIIMGVLKSSTAVLNHVFFYQKAVHADNRALQTASFLMNQTWRSSTLHLPADVPNSHSINRCFDHLFRPKSMNLMGGSIPNNRNPNIQVKNWTTESEITIVPCKPMEATEIRHPLVVRILCFISHIKRALKAYFKDTGSKRKKKIQSFVG